MTVLAFISDPPAVERILRHLTLPTSPPPVAPARASTQERLLLQLPVPKLEDAPGFDLPEDDSADEPVGEGDEVEWGEDSGASQSPIRPPPEGEA